MSKKILITGAGGYIGSNAAYIFLKKGYEIVTIDNLCTGYKGPLEVLQNKFGSDKFRWYELDLKGGLTSFFKTEKGIDAAVHFAAHCSVDESMKNPQKYFSNNVCGSQNLISSMIETGIKNIVFSSTCAVYGEAQYVPVDEDHPTNPANPYGQSKRMVEQMIEWYGKLSGLNYVIFRYFNVCGASDDSLIGDSKKPSLLLIQNAVRGALGIEPFYLTYGEVETKDGSPIRDYINVVDLVEAHLKAVDYLLDGGKSESINLGTGTGYSVLEMVGRVQEITGKKFDLQKSAPRQGEYARVIALIDKAKKVLGWAPSRSIEDSVNSLVKWYKTNPHGWSE